jgi:hypothetical protein
MNAELLYTSAPQGLKQGSRGFCTVLSTAGMPINLAQKLESLSGYRHVYPPKDSKAHLNPVAYSHLKFSVGGRTVSVLSRIADYGLDYSERTNKIAHHVALDPPLPACGPASLLQYPGWMRTEWNGRCETLSQGPAVPMLSNEPGVCNTWQSIAGDAGWGGVVAQSWLDPSPKPTMVIFSEEQASKLLQLIAEAIALLPPNKRWNATFSTYATTLPPDVECRVRCVMAGSEEARKAIGRGTMIDLTRPLGLAADSVAVHAARQGLMVGGDARGYAPSHTGTDAVGPDVSQPADLDPWPEQRPHTEKAVEEEEFDLQLQAPFASPGSGPPPSQKKSKFGAGRRGNSETIARGTTSTRRLRTILVTIAALTLLLTLFGGGALLYLLSQPVAEGSQRKKNGGTLAGNNPENLNENDSHDFGSNLNGQKNADDKQTQIPSEDFAGEDASSDKSLREVGASGTENLKAEVKVENTEDKNSQLLKAWNSARISLRVNLGDTELAYPVIDSVVTATVDASDTKFQTESIKWIWQSSIDGKTWGDIPGQKSGEYRVSEQYAINQLRCIGFLSNYTTARPIESAILEPLVASADIAINTDSMFELDLKRPLFELENARKAWLKEKNVVLKIKFPMRDPSSFQIKYGNYKNDKTSDEFVIGNAPIGDILNDIDQGRVLAHLAKALDARRDFEVKKQYFINWVDQKLIKFKNLENHEESCRGVLLKHLKRELGNAETSEKFFNFENEWTQLSKDCKAACENNGATDISNTQNRVLDFFISRKENYCNSATNEMGLVWFQPQGFERLTPDSMFSSMTKAFHGFDVLRNVDCFLDVMIAVEQVHVSKKPAAESADFDTGSKLSGHLEEIGRFSLPVRVHLSSFYIDGKRIPSNKSDAEAIKGGNNTPPKKIDHKDGIK